MQTAAAAQRADDAWTKAYRAICPKGVWPGDFRYTPAAKGEPGSELHALYLAFVEASEAMHAEWANARTVKVAS
jgi:hypothetical protein